MTIKVLSWNANSIRNKIPELSLFLSKNPHDIILISETWLCPSDTFDLPDFNCHRVDRPHGGVAILLKTHLSYTSLKSVALPNAEAISVKILNSDDDFRIHSLYISPSATRSQAKAFFTSILSTNEPAIFAGDFNAKHNDWNNVTNCRKGCDLSSLCAARRLAIHVPNSPTNYPHRGKPSTIDFVVSNRVEGISDPRTLNTLSSDHLPISFSVPSNTRIPNISLSFNYRQANWKKFRSLVDANIQSTITHNPLLASQLQIDTCVGLLTSIINTAANDSIPKKKPYYHRYPNSDKLQLLKKQRNFYRNQYKTSLDPFAKTMLNLLNRSVRQHTAILNQMAFDDRISKLNTADCSLYAFAKVLKQKNLPIPPLSKSSTELAYSEKEKAETLAKSFLKSYQITLKDTSVHTPEVKNSMRTFRAKASLRSLRWEMSDPKKFANAEVRAICLRLNIRKANGPDLVSNSVMRNLPWSAVELLSNVFNACVTRSYFPEPWKIAKILPIHKKDKPKSDPSSYRPISLLSNIGKVFERLVLDRLNKFEDDNNIFTPNQFGFRKGHSTVQQILRIAEKSCLNFNKNRSTGMVLLDLEKAFDSVWHEGLLHKLHKAGYPMYLVLIIQSYLTNRTALTQVGKSFSDPFDIPAGVPQGSLLSPHLFNIFINDAPLPDNGDLAMFADDTAIFCNVNLQDARRVSKLLVDALSDISNFFKSWKIKLNATKTEFIVFTKSPVMNRKLALFPPIFNGTKFTWKPAVTYLGVILDKSLSFKSHIEHSIAKAKNVTKQLHSLMKKNNPVPIHQKIAIYRTFIRPLMVYACPVFTNCPITHFRKLQIQQNKSLRMALNADWHTRTSDLHLIAQIPTIREHVDKLTANFYEQAKQHSNPLIKNLGSYTRDNISFRLKHRLPLRI